MGKLNGILPIQGTVGNITFAKTADGIIVRQKGGVSAERIATDPAFRRTRENNNEFASAGRAARLILSGLRGTARRKADNRAAARLVKACYAMLKEDTTADRGLRQVSAGNQQHLEGFDLNRHASLQSTLYAPYQAAIDRATGQVSLSLPAFIPEEAIGWPEGATHFEVSIIGTAVNYGQASTETAGATSGVLALGAAQVPPQVLQAQLPAGTTGPILAAISVSFYQMVNGNPYPLSNETRNALAIVKVES